MPPRTLGDPYRTFRYVTLPLLRPGILAAALLAFALSVDDFIVSDFNKAQPRPFRSTSSGRT